MKIGLKIRQLEKSGVKLHCWTEDRERIIGKLKKLNVQEIGILLYINYIAKQMDVVKEGHLLLKYFNISTLSVGSPTSASLCLLLSVHFFISRTASLIACSSSINKDKTRELMRKQASKNCNFTLKKATKSYKNLQLTDSTFSTL